MIHRVRCAALFDEEIRPHYELFRAVANVGSADRVLDIGCGTGESARDAARAAPAGSVLGVDVSEPSLQLARELSTELDNVTYDLGDAQTYRFPPAHFDLCISRFGTMFFADSGAAFENFGRAIRPGGRLVLLVWQARDRNEWATAVAETLNPGLRIDGPDPFTLGYPPVVEGILQDAGFDQVEFRDVHEPVYYGPDVDTACDLVLGLFEPRQLLAGMAPGAADDARARLRGLIAPHQRESGVFFDSRAWIVTAVKRSAG